MLLLSSQAARRRRKHRNPIIGQEKFLLLASSCFAGKGEMQGLEMRRVRGVRRCDVSGMLPFKSKILTGTVHRCKQGCSTREPAGILP